MSPAALSTAARLLGRRIERVHAAFAVSVLERRIEGLALVEPPEDLTQPADAVAPVREDVHRARRLHVEEVRFAAAPDDLALVVGAQLHERALVPELVERAALRVRHERLARRLSRDPVREALVEPP